MKPWQTHIQQGQISSTEQVVRSFFSMLGTADLAAASHMVDKQFTWFGQPIRPEAWTGKSTREFFTSKPVRVASMRSIPFSELRNIPEGVQHRILGQHQQDDTLFFVDLVREGSTVTALVLACDPKAPRVRAVFDPSALVQFIRFTQALGQTVEQPPS